MNKNDLGECWFEESNAEKVIIDYVLKNFNNNKQKKFLDIGTGNGHFLFELEKSLNEFIKEKKSEFVFHGIDYSINSIKLTKKIIDTHYKNSVINFNLVDFLNVKESFFTLQKNSFDVIFDKGTLDAIVLNVDYNLTNKINLYCNQMKKLVHKDSLIIITSCNFTEKELSNLLKKNDFYLEDKIEYSKFMFSGVIGSTIHTLIFKCKLN